MLNVMGTLRARLLLSLLAMSIHPLPPATTVPQSTHACCPLSRTRHAQRWTCRMPEGQPANSQVAGVFQSRLVAIFSAAARTAGYAPDAMAQLIGLLDLWRDRGVFGPEVTTGVTASLRAAVCYQPLPIMLHACCQLSTWGSAGGSASICLSALQAAMTPQQNGPPSGPGTLSPGVQREPCHRFSIGD
jgi:hypothetical protein